ncbi:MAG: hypothetical protein DRR42_23315 [Gammaproteobacteria bacterium]|nr:MAG: hypothetical protein DRR42_23315 [Gammaproteobacteria bacterium]
MGFLTRRETWEDDLGESGSELSRISSVDVKVPLGSSPEELAHDEPKDEELATYRNHSPKASRRSIAMQSRSAAGAANRISQRNHDNPCDRESLKTHNVVDALNIVFLPKTADTARAVLALSIFLGRPISRIMNLLSLKENEFGETLLRDKHGYVLACKIDLPEDHLSGPLAKRAGENKNIIYLGVPQVVFASLDAAIRLCQSDSTSLDEKVAGLSSRIRSATGGRATPLRLSKYLKIEAKRIGMDSVDVANLVGIPAQECPEKYYDLTDVEYVVDFHLEYMSTLLRSTLQRVEFRKGIRSQASMVGSRLCFTCEEAEGFIGELRSRASQNYGNSVIDILKRQNWRTLYTYQLAALATAARAIRAPFQYRSDFDFHRGIVWVNDKQSRSGLAARQINLAPTVLAQIQLYISDLSELEKYFRYLDPEISKKIYQASVSKPCKDTFESATPFMSVFQIEKGIILMDPITPTYQIQSGLWGTHRPTNWQRHFMRQQLKKRGVSRNLIQAILGHGDFGAEAEGLWSGLSFADGRKVAEVIECILHSIGAYALDGAVVLR